MERLVERSRFEPPAKPAYGIARILLVDDDQHLLKALQRALADRGFEVITAQNAGEAIRQIESQQLDALVLDVVMPVVNGLQLCRLIRDQVQAPILILSAMDDVNERIEGLEAGADDYLTKPFSTDELAARLRALLRRKRLEVSPEGIVNYGRLAVDRYRWEASFAGKPLDLTTKEFRILALLISSPGRAFPRDAILTAVWREGESVESNVVDVHIASLRQKLTPCGAGDLIKTIRGVGYSLRE